MSLASAIALMIVLVMPNGEARRLFIEQPSIETCFAQAQRFMARKPEEFRAIAIGAGCIVHPHGQSS